MNEPLLIRQLDRFIELAKEKGFEIRREMLGGIGSSVCEIRGKPCLFLDVSTGPAEQLETIRQSLSMVARERDVRSGTSI